MAEQIPFSIAEEILTKLGSLVAQEIGLARGVRKELKKLEDTLTTIKAVLLDAEERQEREHAVEVLVKRFKDVIYDADDLLDDFATYELGRGGMARQVNTLHLNCKCLRALSLAVLGLTLPKSLTKLRSLRYLDLFWGGFKVLPSGITSLQNLQTLKLFYCRSLRELPRDMRKMRSLRHLEIGGCDRLNYMPCRLGELTMLQTLRLVDLDALEYMFKNSSSAEPFPSLKTLELDMLYNLKGWWRDRGEQAPSFPSLSQLLIRYGHQLTTVQLPSCPFSKFEIRWCNQLTTVQLLSSPTKLVINHCRSFKSLQLPCSSSLSELEISCCDQLTTVELPSCPSLSTLEIRRCDQLTTVQLLSSPTKLVIDDCRSFKSLQLPSCSSLSELEIHGCNELTTFQLLSSPHLSKLVIGSCHSLKSLQLPSCPSLFDLEISWCDQLTSVQLQLQVPSLPCLEELKLRGVREEILWQIILVSSSLKSLHIWNINDLVSLPDDLLQHLTSLKSLEIWSCYELMSLFQGIQHLGALEELQIYHCMRLNLSDKEDDDGGLQFQGLRSLRKLFIGGIPKLVSLPKGLQHVTTLETLAIINCDDFTTLPDWISYLTSLSKLDILNCPRLKLENRSKIAHIREIDIH
ncbi:hypothetical protein VitviT2T_020559 [Vitis vinifera]|uniref:Rx N-terminal domain-containing protein n=1 Tax=Vitis vinifera TaxID=29760 RepID=A0ABY9D4S3_VITVI|nr:hypothetical protein VitviT2T_020559 [Vitis vinifera]